MASETSCPTCGASFDAKMRFCPLCGHATAGGLSRGCLVAMLIALISVLGISSTCALSDVRGPNESTVVVYMFHDVGSLFALGSLLFIGVTLWYLRGQK